MSIDRMGDVADALMRRTADLEGLAELAELLDSRRECAQDRYAYARDRWYKGIMDGIGDAPERIRLAIGGGR